MHACLFVGGGGAYPILQGAAPSVDGTITVNLPALSIVYYAAYVRNVSTYMYPPVRI